MDASLKKPIETEEDVLRAEAAQARNALHDALSGIKHSLARTADPVQWAETHPWISVGVAAATGFAAASAIVPARGQRASNKWSEVAHRFSPLSKNSVSDSPQAADDSVKARPAPTMWAALVDVLFEMAKLAITNFVTTARAKSMDTARPESAADQNGNGDPSELRAD